MKVIIANSVGVNEDGNHIVHFPSRWTSSCGRTKPFTYYPYELAYLSSLLKRETDYHIKMIDGNLLQLDADAYIELLANEKPDWLIMETATMVYPEDLKVALALKKKFGTKIIFTGPHSTAFPEKTLADGVDYVCIGEYEYTVLDILKGIPPEKIPGLYPNSYRPLLDVNSLPWPEDEDISRANYVGIGGSDYKEIEVFGSRGCPNQCIFCVAGNLYYKKPNWRPRDVKDIVAELMYLKNKYPEIEGFFFDEEEHNVSKKFIKELTQEIKRHGMDDMKINAMCGYWTLDKEMMQAMYEAGYYKLRIGIETASEIVAKAMNKKIDIPKLINVLENAKSIGLKMYGTFTMGAPVSTKEEDLKTVRLIRELVSNGLLDELQISICIPQPGTPFYKWAEKNGYLITYNWRDYDGATKAVISYPNYKNVEIEEIFSLACDVWHAEKKFRKYKDQGLVKALRREITRYGVLTTIKKGINMIKTVNKLRQRLDYEMPG